MNMGNRGEGWFALQLVLFALILLAPRIEQIELPFALRLLGLAFLLLGGLLGSLGLLALGRNISPFPKPIKGGQLIQSGIYSWVRHPIYSGLILGTLGWALAWSTLLGVVLVLALFVFFDMKSRREEVWLRESYPDYADYQKRVKKLIPGVY